MTATEVNHAQRTESPPNALPLERSTGETLEAHVGDRIFVPGPNSAGPVRDGLVLQVRRRDGRPPYRVRWSDTHSVSLVFPGPGTYLHHDECDPEPA